MDADYRRVLGPKDNAGYEHALFVLTSVMKASLPGGQSPTPASRPSPSTAGCRSCTTRRASPARAFRRALPARRPGGAASGKTSACAIPGHCDPTCNLHDWYVGYRGDRVEIVWPVTARGKLFSGLAEI